MHTGLWLRTNFPLITAPLFLRSFLLTLKMSRHLLDQRVGRHLPCCLIAMETLEKDEPPVEMVEK